MPQMAWLFSTAHVEGLKNESFSVTRRGKKISFARTESEKRSRGRREHPRTDQRLLKQPRSKEVQQPDGVPVRQIRVAELDDDVAVRFSEATRRKRNVIRGRRSLQ